MKKIFTILSIVALGVSANAQIVINEVYGAGGNAGATLKNDYVELINNGSASATISNVSLQYASATGTFNGYHVLPTITLSPGQTYLIEMVPATANTIGGDLPTADYQVTNNTSFITGTTYNGGLNFSGSNGKIALVQGDATTAVQATGPSSSGVIDFVGYGSATLFEGTAAAPAPSATKSISRTNGVDTNSNSADFTAVAPTPKNSAGVTLAVGDVTKSKINLVKSTVVKDILTFGAKSNVKVVNFNGQVLKSVSVENGTTLDVSSLAKGVYLIKGDVNGETVVQKIIKQ